MIFHCYPRYMIWIFSRMCCAIYARYLLYTQLLKTNEFQYLLHRLFCLSINLSHLFLGDYYAAFSVAVAGWLPTTDSNFSDGS